MRRVAVVNVPLEANRVREIMLEGMRFVGVLSPFDFPERLRIAISDRSDQATVDFLYAAGAEEESVPNPGPQGSKLHLGKTSGRIMKMEFPIPLGSGGQRLRLEIMVQEPLAELKKKAESMTWDARPARRLAHYEMLPGLLSLIEQKLEKLRMEQGAMSGR